MQFPDWTIEVVDFVQAYAQHVAVGAGAAGALIAARTIRRFTKKREHDDVAANLGVALFAVVTTEGMWEVVHNKLGVNIGLTIAMFAAFDVVVYAQGRLAIRKLTGNPKARVGTYLTIIWALSTAAAITVSTAGGNLTTQLFRLFSPMVAAALWTQKALELRNGKIERAESNWIWTPTRLMIRWGWLKPGAADDLTEVLRDRRITALVDAGLTLHAEQEAARLRPAAPSRRRMRRQRDPLADARRRVQRLTKSALAEDVTAARVQLRRVLTIEVELFRDDSQPTQRERELMDELRVVMRQATTKLRAEGAAAFGPDLREPMVELGGIRMPAHIAAQIGPLPEPYPAHSGGALEALVEVVGESGVESIRPAPTEPVREPSSDSPRTTAATQRPAQRAVTERLTAGSPTTDDRRIRQAHTRLTRRLGREPTGAELGEAAGVSKATANRWKSSQK